MDHLQRWFQIFRSEETETDISIWILTEISGIFGIMESAPYLTSKDINDIISQFTSSQFVVFLYPKNIM